MFDLAFTPRPWAVLAVTVLASTALLAPAHAQWKWRDSRGQIHVSDTPPPRDVPDKDVLQRPEVTVRRAPAPAASAASGVAGNAAASPKAPADPELEERKRRAEQDQAAKQKAEEAKAAAVRKDNCQRARDQLAMLESGQRMARMKPDGEREYLSDDQRAKEAQRTRGIIATDCR